MTESASDLRLMLGDCLERLREMEDCSVDSVVTDPPYGLSFMGKKWDYDVPSEDIWRECLRVLKPGGHLLAFAGTRTQHRMAVRIEDAGFEIRDMIAWVYGSGFPKSHNLKDGWDGWGTALKPALEPITVARKPLGEKTVAANVLAHGTGAINVDGCRVGTETIQTNRYTPGRDMTSFHGSQAGNEYASSTHAGRWPANLIHDGSDEVVGLFPDAKSGGSGNDKIKVGGNCYGKYKDRKGGQQPPSSGSAARFFYCAKTSKRDRNEGLDGFEVKAPAYESYRENLDAKGGDTPFAGAGRSGIDLKNHHPTVKPTALMRYLCRLVTPPEGIVLDPFMGSGSTGKAAMLEGFQFIGIERDAEYFEIATNRIAVATPRQLEMAT
jgi:DNA modification methylase